MTGFPCPAIADLSTAVIALVTSGGIVPKGNPDRIESANASKFAKYYIGDIDDLVQGEFETIHGGYDPVYALEDPDRFAFGCCQAVGKGRQDRETA